MGNLLSVILSGFFIVLTTGPSAPAATLDLAPQVSGEFKVKDRPDEGISGIACEPISPNGSSACLVINDELSSAQWASQQGNIVTVGLEQPLLSERDIANAAGTSPLLSCPGGSGKFGEFDGEGVSVDSKYFYVTGSHGCSRNKGKFKASGFIVARIDKADHEKIDLSYRLSEVLSQDAHLSKFFGRSIQAGEATSDENGLNIEGVLAIGSRIYFGLRGPSLKGDTFIVSVDIRALFNKSAQLNPDTMRVHLGTDRGIRDLAVAKDGQILILAGPRTGEGGPFSIERLDYKKGILTRLGEVPTESGKAEGLLPRYTSEHPDLLWVFFDGRPNGGPVAVTFSSALMPSPSSQK